MIKGVIFDFDGTLADTLPLCIAAFKKAISPVTGKAYSDRDITDTFGPSEEGTIHALVGHPHDQAVEDYLVHYRALHGDAYPLFPGILPLIEKLISRGIHIGMVTGKGVKSLAISLEILQLNQMFSEIRCGEPGGPSKVKGIRSILEAWQLEPGEAVYIGDAPSDIVFSREVGIPIISVAYAGSAERDVLRDLNPDALVDTVDGLEVALMDMIERSKPR